ncbi:translational GTPase TypA [Dialister micraerophilus]|uniref:Large ribosomal subunit assembly factor BipA n=1 Tax=Dialister micraerophilus DSM 19965 TaxID=888062 RepID=F2BW89_9FIRM|nr:translational GTPase TypA [Dialister micraerophilus]EGF15244.1 glutathione-disulfide reductase [Dialister micraerophilus DSM 19965]MDK8285388.1 translational GTPase TypA [Dialister micraerophilus]MDU5301784.1 translational GTPase TypA [Dialister micraerophilus]
MIREDIRNIAIIAHVDHGKTTLVDAMLRQSHIFRENQKVVERVMDSNPLERERGITILAKNTSVMHNGVKINIVDTPGHADFGGEVERILNMVDGVLLLVDSHEGPMPQTKYVLRKALEHKLKPIVVINKIDRPDERISEVEGEILDLFVELDADDDQLDFPLVYASARDGIAKLNMKDEGKDLEPLFKTIMESCPPPEGEPDEPLQIMVTTLESDDYLGKVAIGRITRGTVKKGMKVAITDGEKTRNDFVGQLFNWQGMKRTPIEEAKIGDIIAIAGFKNITIGETVSDAEHVEALPTIKIDEPTLSMVFRVNKSPFAGREGDYVTSRHIRARLMKEIETNVALKVEDTDTADAFLVSGRGELHLSVLIEVMRREGYELEVSKPQVIYKEIDGKRCEPLERLTIEVPQEFMGAVMEGLGPRRAEMISMEELAGYIRMEFSIPARGLLGFRNELLTTTRGTGILYHVFQGYSPYKGDIPERTRGSLVAFEAGTTTAYGLNSILERGTLFIDPGVEVYEGMIIGENSRENDMDVNPCKKKHLTNTRASGSDEAIRLPPCRQYTLEGALEWIADDELVEVTPKSVRMRKQVISRQLRYKNAKKK